MPFPEQTEIRCCSSHYDYLTPVLGTTKFDYHEFWCPHCGRKYEFFDGFSYCKKSDLIERRKILFEQISLAYLSDQTDDYIYHQKPDQNIGSG